MSNLSPELTPDLLIDPLYQHTIILGFAMLYAISAWHKIKQSAVFRATLENYQIMPKTLVSTAAASITIIEGVTALLLLTPWYLLGIGLGVALQTSYGLALSINLARGRTHIDCGCMGADGEGISVIHPIRNLALLLLLSSAALPVASRALTLVDATIMLFALPCMVVAYAAVNTLLSNHAQQMAWR